MTLKKISSVALILTSIIAPNLALALPTPPPIPLPPDRSGGGGSRGECPASAVTLAPASQGQTVGSTASDRPTLWAYLPFALTPNTPAVLVIKDVSSGADLYKSPPITAAPIGIASFPLPASAPALVEGQVYDWYLRIYCDDADRDDDPQVVGGRIQRVATSVPATNRWYDRLSTLAELRRREPNNARLTIDWARLLQSEGLADLVTQPIAPCCTVPDREALRR